MSDRGRSVTRRSPEEDWHLSDHYIAEAYGAAHERAQAEERKVGDRVWSPLEYIALAAFYLLRSRWPA